MRNRSRRWLLPFGVMGTMAILSTTSSGGAADNVDGRFAMMQRRVDSLESRLAAEELRQLTAAPSGRVKAPFEVVDAHGSAILSVQADSAARGVVITDAAGGTAVVLGITGDQNFVRVVSPGRKRQILLATTDTRTAAVLRDGNDRTHTRAALAMGDDGVPALQINNDKYVNVLSVTHGPHGGGLIQVNEPKGEPRVELGSTGEGFGVVKTGPGGQCSAPFGPIAPSCLLGRKGN